MNKRFYPRLAAQNLRKNRVFFRPYLLTVLGAAAAFYMMLCSTHLENIEGLGNFISLETIMPLGVFVVGLVTVLFLFYTNSFLMKQRGKEFALYSVLGMAKGHIARALCWETVYTVLLGVGGGLIAGFVFNRLLLLLLCRLVGVTYVGPSIYWDCAGRTAVFFVVLLALVFLVNSGRIGLSQPVALLYGKNAGEREPKARWLLALLGLALLGAGYYIAITTQSPLQALILFFVAVLLVIAGTFLLFLAGSVTLLKLLRKHKRFYYRTRHFVSVSALMYRMKRNAAGLAIICVLSTAVLVMMSSTVTLYAGMEDMLDALFPRNIMAYMGSHDREAWVYDPEETLDALTAAGFHPENVLIYDDLLTSGLLTEEGFSCDQHVEVSGWDAPNEVKKLAILPEESYEIISGERLDLGPGEIFLRGRMELSETLTVFGEEFAVSGRLPENEIFRAYESENAMVDLVELVVSAGDFETLYERQAEGYGDHRGYILTHLDFDLPDGESEEECRHVLGDSMQAPEDVWNTARYDHRGLAERDCRGMFGGLLWLGMFLGVLFLAGTVLIIYYKQISEGYEDQDRFEILQKVGMTRPEVAGAIRSQVLLMFFLPLGTAVLHMAAATPMLLRLLRAFQFTNTGLFIGCVGVCAAVFAGIYTLVYAVTARTYYGVVSRE